MKIEIELSEIEALRRDADNARKEVDSLRHQIEYMQKDNLESKAIRLGEYLCNEYLKGIFVALGFTLDGWDRKVVDLPSDYTMEGKWFKEPKNVKVNLSASISEQFKKAFIRVGLDTDKMNKPE